MSIEVEAVYEGGILKPDRQLPLQEHQRVKLVVEEWTPAPHAAGEEPKWWNTLKQILARQKERGFVGTATGVESDDEEYEQRMRSIWKNTIHGDAAG